MGREGDQQTSSSVNALCTPGVSTAGEKEAGGREGVAFSQSGGIGGGWERVFQVEVSRASRRPGQRSEDTWNRLLFTQALGVQVTRGALLRLAGRWPFCLRGGQPRLYTVRSAFAFVLCEFRVGHFPSCFCKNVPWGYLPSSVSVSQKSWCG